MIGPALTSLFIRSGGPALYSTPIFLTEVFVWQQARKKVYLVGIVGQREVSISYLLLNLKTKRHEAQKSYIIEPYYSLSEINQKSI